MGSDPTARYRRTAGGAPMLSFGEEQELVRRYREGSRAALSALVQSHFRLVLSAARRFVGNGTPLEDLVSEGNLGLLEAARRFDPERGTRFATYAAWWVRARIRSHAHANRRIVGPPSSRNVRRVLSQLRRVQRAFAQKEGRPPTRMEIATHLEVTETDIAVAEAALGGRDLPVLPGEWLGELALADPGPSPEQLAAPEERRAHRHREVGRALRTLSEREQEIVRRRSLSEEVTTLAVLGQDLGLSRERVRQIEQRAHSKLRASLLDLVA